MVGAKEGGLESVPSVLSQVRSVPFFGGGVDAPSWGGDMEVSRMEV